ncbi:hypothetical protein NDU88_005114 [Pleurodeles waltl]|uniref:Uncharacterized protein n=1 Tax=Pleurodeles waltl TaxID=8319 RepID=A0AAV7WUA6_PLEWA|nr:hypothetical protein NDU88_005114 [Pleurodeles waltl]
MTAIRRPKWWPTKGPQDSDGKRSGGDQKGVSRSSMAAKRRPRWRQAEGSQGPRQQVASGPQRQARRQGSRGSRRPRWQQKQETLVAAGKGASGAATATGGGKQRDLRGSDGELQEQRRGSKEASGSAAARVPKGGRVHKAIPRGPWVRDGDVVNPIPYSYV